MTLMSACSGRNYNFLCINVVFDVFLRESARTAAKSPTNLSTNSGKATKRLGRLAPNLAHVCKFILECIYSKQMAPRDTRGTRGGGGFRGQHATVWGSCQTAGPIGTNFGSRLRIHMGMDILQTNCHSRHKEALGGF